MKIIHIGPGEALRQATMTANDYMGAAWARVKEYGVDPKEHPEAFATLVAAHMHASVTDYRSSTHAMAADNLVEALQSLSVSASIHMEESDE